MRTLFLFTILCLCLTASAATTFQSAQFGIPIPTGCVAPSISGQPSSITCVTNTTTNFTVTASGTATLAYQWRDSGAGTNLANGTAFSGVTTATLWASNVTATFPTNYAVVITNACGSITSQVASLTVTNGAGGGFNTPADYSPVAWWSADYAITNVAFNTPATNGEDVASVGDKSGNNNVLTSKASVYFVFNTNQQNSLPAITTSQASWLTCAHYTQGAQSQPLTIYFTAYYSHEAAVNVAFISGTASNPVAGAVYDSFQSYLYGGLDVFGSDSTAAGWHTWVFILDGASSSVTLDGAEVMTGSIGSNAMDGMMMLNNSGAASKWRSKWGETIVYSGHHNSTYIANVWGWLKSKWNTP